MKSSRKDTLAELRAAIGQQIKPVATATPAPAASKPAGKGSAHAKKTPPARSVTPTSAAPELPARSGRGMQFYLDDTDRKIIHGLATWFGSQDRRVSDSQVVKSVIRFASIQPGARLLEICDAVRATDRRLQKAKPAKTAKKP